MKRSGLDAQGWNRHSLIVERGKLEDRSGRELVLHRLQVPPAAHWRSRRYARWRDAVGNAIRTQRPRRVGGPVAISIVIEERSSRTDLAILAQASIDMLADLQLIDGEGGEIVREVNIRPGRVEGMHIEVKSA